MNNCFLTTSIKVPLGCTDPKPLVAKRLGLGLGQLQSVVLHKQSIDARDKSDVHFVCSYVVRCTKTPKNAIPYLPPQDLLISKPISARGKCVVVGSGPAGLFAARYLAGAGVEVTVVERGSDILLRRQKVQNFFNGGQLDEDCNVQFGLGGAGTFSDGKLTSGSSSPLVNTVFAEFVRCGAPRQILTDSLPHIGTDNLVSTVDNLKKQIQADGGTFLFDATVTDLIVQKGKAVGVEVLQGGKVFPIFADCVALCCGHSAKNVYEMLLKKGVEMASKPFAVGLRVEHPRKFIDFAQYGAFATHRDLGAATYKLVHNLENCSCYSFCMCPGGTVVCATSQKGSVVVNGMSNFNRDAENSNSALVVSVSQNDLADYGFGTDCLAGLRFQESLEQSAYKLGGGNFVAPAQNVTDFLAGKLSTTFDTLPTHPRGVVSANLRTLFPEKITDALATSLQVFNNKIKGFATCGVLTAVESRTSSPVKILRDKSTLQTNVAALFPVGEGAGHAGGIVTSAVDGLKAAQAIVQFLQNCR